MEEARQHPALGERFTEAAFPAPPIAERRPLVLDLHGDRREDAYAWLRDRAYPSVEDAAIRAYLDAENAYADAVFGADPDLRPALFQELKSRIRDEDDSVPFRYRGAQYFWRFTAGAEHRQHWRRLDAELAEDELLLDIEALAQGHAFYEVGALAVSPDGTLLAYAEDTSGAERYDIRVKNLRTGDLVAEHVSDAAASIVWSKDSDAFYYVKLDAEQRPRFVMRHVIGSDARLDPVLYEETDPTYWTSIDDGYSGRFLFVVSAAKTSREVRFRPLDASDAALTIVSTRRPEHEYSVIDRGDDLYVLTNDRHRNFRVCVAPLATPGEAHWRERVAPSDACYLLQLVAMRDWWALFEREAGLTRIRIFDETGDHLVAFPEAAYSVSAETMAEGDLPALRIRYSSPATPPSVFDYHVRERRLERLKQLDVPTYDPSRYTVERIEAPARDGTLVPVTILRRRDAPRDGSAPLLLYGYGAYGAGIEPGFQPGRFCLVERGFAWAIAHIRGGDELGYHWYEDGKKLNKQNSFSDFIDVARHLVAEGYTRAGNIAALGGSAGGLLVGAAMNQAPELFRAVLAIVPFVDALNTMLDASLPLTPLEYEEWGNPADEPYYRAIRAYSPYDNIEAKAYPHVFASAGLADPRVTYWEPAKWVARLRATKIDDRVIVLRTNMSAGHGGASGRYRRLHESAEEYAFVLKAFGFAR